MNTERMRRLVSIGESVDELQQVISLFFTFTKSLVGLSIYAIAKTDQRRTLRERQRPRSDADLIAEMFRQSRANNSRFHDDPIEAEVIDD